MKKTVVENDKFLKKPNERPKDHKVVSHSQYSIFMTCPYKWKLKYIDKCDIAQKPSIHMVFGNAMHSVIQNYLHVLFTKTIKESDNIDFEFELLNALKAEYKREVENNNNDNFSSKTELMEFYTDGIEILNFLRKKRTHYFDKKEEEFIGSEISINTQIHENGPWVLAYIDLVFRNKNTNKYRILDIKSSTRGWDDWQKKDTVKLDQVLIYKKFFSIEYDIPIDDIDVEFFILRRKIDLSLAYPPRRIQQFSPPSKSMSIKKFNERFAAYIEHCFQSATEYKLNAQYPPLAGKDYRNCKFCEFNREDLCPMQKRFTE